MCYYLFRALSYLEDDGIGFVLFCILPSHTLLARVFPIALITAVSSELQAKTIAMQLIMIMIIIINMIKIMINGFLKTHFSSHGYLNTFTVLLYKSHN